MNYYYKRNSVFSFEQSYEGKKLNDLGEMQAYQGTAIGWDWRRRGSNNNFVLRKRSPLMPSPIRVDINYFFFFFFPSFFRLFYPCSLLLYRPTPSNQLCARHWSPSPFWRRFAVNLPEDQLWTRIHWGNWNFSLQSLDFCIAFAREGRGCKNQIFWKGHTNLKKIYHSVLTLLRFF